jgi:hypothetical protein
MLQVCSVYSQLLQLFSRGQFARAVKHHQAERNAKGFSSWEQFVRVNEDERRLGLENPWLEPAQNGQGAEPNPPATDHGRPAADQQPE